VEKRWCGIVVVRKKVESGREEGRRRSVVGSRLESGNRGLPCWLGMGMAKRDETGRETCVGV